MRARRLGAVVLATFVAMGFAIEVHGRSESSPSPTPRAGVATTRRPRAQTSEASDAGDVDARALVAALLLEGARHGWQAR